MNGSKKKQKKQKTARKDGRCLLQACQRPAFARGVCQRDYLAMHRAVQAGKTNWETLISEGLCLPDARGPKAVATKHINALTKGR